MASPNELLVGTPLEPPPPLKPTFLRRGGGRGGHITA